MFFLESQKPLKDFKSKIELKIPIKTYNILNRKFYECADQNLIPFFSNKTILEQGKKITTKASF